PTKNLRRWSSEDEQRSCLTTMVPSSKTTHRFPNRRQLQEGATLRDKARASWSSFALRATQAHRLDFGLAELVRPVALRRVSHSRSDFPYARPSTTPTFRFANRCILVSLGITTIRF